MQLRIFFIRLFLNAISEPANPQTATPPVTRRRPKQSERSPSIPEERQMTKIREEALRKLSS